MQKINEFDVIQNGLEKYTAFTININFAFIDSMQLMSSILNKFVKKLSDKDLKYLSQKW